MSAAEQAMIKAFGMTDEVWQRHANPWSVYTRIPIPGLFVLAVWSRTWIGRWSLVPVGAVVLWTAVNPRVFPPPRSTDRWATQAVLGEQLWTARKKRGTTPRRRVAPAVLNAVNVVGAAVIARGLVVRDPWMTATGLALQTAGKNWTLDRMVWHYEDVSRELAAVPEGNGVPVPRTDQVAAR